jgi:hypothetical protein
MLRMPAMWQPSWYAPLLFPNLKESSCMAAHKDNTNQGLGGKGLMNMCVIRQEQLAMPGANPDEIDAQGKTVLIHAAAQV